MSLDDDVSEYIQQKCYRSRGKCAIYARQSDVYVEVKQKPNYCAPVPATADSTNCFIDIAHDVWFHVALHLDPEDVQTFALVCTQFNRLVNSRVFWRNLYRRYCLKGSGSKWNLDLPGHLQLEQIHDCDTKSLRLHVIEALFHCHHPLKLRVAQDYNLDWLLQRTLVSCSQEQYRCMWIICYTLWHQQSSQVPVNYIKDSLFNNAETDSEANVVNDWETLADNQDVKKINLHQKSLTPHEGVVLLIVVTRQFTPLPAQLLYNQQQSRFRLKATREMLCTDMRAKNLELDFVEENSNSQLCVGVKYSRIEKYKVLPWWHSDFKKFFK